MWFFTQILDKFVIEWQFFLLFTVSLATLVVTSYHAAKMKPKLKYSVKIRHGRPVIIMQNKRLPDINVLRVIAKGCKGPYIGMNEMQKENLYEDERIIGDLNSVTTLKYNCPPIEIKCDWNYIDVDITDIVIQANIEREKEWHLKKREIEWLKKEASARNIVYISANKHKGQA